MSNLSSFPKFGSGAGGGLPEVFTEGMFLQMLTDGPRWIDTIDGGNAMGVVVYVAPTPGGGGSEDQTASSFDFTGFTSNSSEIFTF